MAILATPAESVVSSSSPRCVVCGLGLPKTVCVQLGEFRLFECDSCGSWTSWPRETVESQAQLHDSTEYFDHPYFELRRRTTPAFRKRCRRVFAQLGKGVELASLRGQRFLDIGCDAGAFLSCAQADLGVVPVGIDVAGRAVELCRRARIEAHRCSIEEAPAHVTDFPVITAIDLIEHVVNPAAFLVEVRKRLRPGGVFYAETPNIRSVVYKTGRWFSALAKGKPVAALGRLFPPQHVQYFTIQSLVGMARLAGLEPVDVTTRVLPGADIAVSWPVRLALSAMQTLDRPRRSGILISGLFRRSI